MRTRAKTDAFYQNASGSWDTGRLRRAVQSFGGLTVSGLDILDSRAESRICHALSSSCLPRFLDIVMPFDGIRLVALCVPQNESKCIRLSHISCIPGRGCFLTGITARYGIWATRVPFDPLCEKRGTTSVAGTGKAQKWAEGSSLSAKMASATTEISEASWQSTTR